MKKKNLKESAIRYEINLNLDKVIEVLGRLNFINTSEVWFESLAYDWIDNEPPEEDLDRVLKELGY
nr:MAG TPA: hypothetical protein [Caudoviricetes sp.]